MFSHETIDKIVNLFYFVSVYQSTYSAIHSRMIDIFTGFIHRISPIIHFVITNLIYITAARLDQPFIIVIYITYSYCYL